MPASVGLSPCAEALLALDADGIAVRTQGHLVPDKPGLYALRGSRDTWKLLGLGAPPDHRPLYVGKAEDSLGSRDVRTHFGTGRTGSSTLRRTVGALLAEPFGLVAQPRDPGRPGHFSNYAFEPAGEARLTEWMLDHLTLVTWVPSRPVALGDVEAAVLKTLLPPLNIAKVRTPWRAHVTAARKQQSISARRWTP